MKIILNEKQKYLIALGYNLLVKEFSFSPDHAKRLLFETLVKELKLRNITMESFETSSRAERHAFIRNVANRIGEHLVVVSKFKRVEVHEQITQFMLKMNEQSQLLRNKT